MILNEAYSGVLTDLEFCPSGDYLYFNMDYPPYLAYLDLSTLSPYEDPYDPDADYTDYGLEPVPTPSGVTTAEKLQYASGQISAQYFDGSPTIFYCNSLGLSTFKNSNVPQTGGVFIENNISVSMNTSYFSGTWYFLNKQNFGNQQVNELALSECCETNALSKHMVVEGYATAADEDWDANNNPFETNGESEVIFCQDLVIEDGANIDITGMTFMFTEEAEMTIEQGAQVKLYGTTLTSVCERTWPGVDILGDGNLDQFPSAGGDQGYLLMESASMIENAEIGAHVKSGGVLKSRNSTFRNNWIGVYMNPYSNLHDGNGTVYNNFSYFQDCLFETTPGGLVDDQAPYVHLSMWGVDGIRVRGCSFENNASYSTLSGNERGMGIIAYHSTFDVSGDGVTDSFSSLYHGINTYNCGPYKCNDMTFYENAYGIYNSMTDDPEIYENLFEIPDKDSKYGVKVPIGVYLTNSTGYKVTRNDFGGIFSSPALAIGCRVHQSGGDNNYIYKNNFDNLRYGAYVEGLNRGAQEQRGLQVLCNGFTSGVYDEYVTLNAEWRQDQGGNQQDIQLEDGQIFEAGNRFSLSYPDCSNYADIRINDNNSEYTNYYCHDQPNTIPDCGGYNSNPDPGDPNDLLTNIISVGESYSSSECPSSFFDHGMGGHGSHGTAPVSWVETKSILFDLDQELEQSWAVYHQTVDKDSTDYVLQVLNNAYAQESTYVRDLLLQKYPLSKEVLIKLVEEGEHLDPWHLTQVMVANAPIEPDVMDFLVNSQLLSEFFLDFIRNADGSDNLKELLEFQIRGLYEQRDKIRQSLTRDYLLTFTDSTLSLDSSTVIFKSEYENLWSEYPNHLSRAKMFLREQQPDSALAIVNEIDDQQLKTHWQNFINLSQTPVSTELDSATITQMESEWLDASNPLGPVYLGILQASQTTDESLDYEISTRSFRTNFTDRNSASSATGYIGVYPNPMNSIGYITFPAEVKEIGRIEIRTIEGKKVQTFELDSSNGILEISTANWSPGLYLVTLMLEDRKIETVKFAVSH